MQLHFETSPKIKLSQVTGKNFQINSKKEELNTESS
jgi:hypothetical protein